MARRDEIQNALNAWQQWPDATPKNATNFWLLLDAYNGWQRAQTALDALNANSPAPAPLVLDDAAALAADQLENTTREKMRDDANFKTAMAKIVPAA